ncbi:MAG: GAF domain-containing protein [Planctomycetes bacterium]|nr:GAF domain-containing protein [Planctomycetota bacterium]
MAAERLFEVARYLVRAGPGEDMYRTLATRTRRALGRGHGTSFFLVYRASNVVLPVAESSESGHHLHPEAYTQKISAGIIGHVIKSGRTHYAPDVSADPLFVSGGQTGGSELCVPVKVEGDVAGIFNIESTRKNGFPPDVIARVELLCEAVGVLMNTGVAQEQQQAMEAQIRGLEEGLAHARARFEGLARMLPDAVLILDPGGKVSWQNGAWKNALKGSEGKLFETLIAEKSQASWRKAAAKGGTVRCELAFGRTSRAVSGRTLPLAATDGPAGLLVLLAATPAPKGKATKKKRK